MVDTCTQSYFDDYLQAPNLVFKPTFPMTYDNQIRVGYHPPAKHAQFFRLPINQIKVRVGAYLSKDEVASGAAGCQSTKTSPRVPDTSTLNTDRNPPSQRNTAAKNAIRTMGQTAGFKNQPPMEGGRTQYSVKW